MINIQLVGLADYRLDDPDTCDNVGLCCLSCPMYDACDHHYEEETT